MIQQEHFPQHIPRQYDSILTSANYKIMFPEKQLSQTVPQSVVGYFPQHTPKQFDYIYESSSKD
jgi:hypothetical protein